jgi:hypothetical protein
MSFWSKRARGKSIRSLINVVTMHEKEEDK